MKLSEMKQILAAHDLHLTKSLGQNFLHDANQLQRIVRAAELRPDDKVLEIGPGLGPLTELLLQHAGQVLAIEKDKRLVKILRQRFAGAQNLELIEGDALDYIREHQEWQDWKVVSNLPYSVASPLLVELAQCSSPRESKKGTLPCPPSASSSPELIVATLQLEVVQRIMAKANSEHYGLLAVLVQLRYQPAGHFKIPAACFFPQPDVDSACIKLQRRTEPLLPVSGESTFTDLVKQGFSQRRKMMYKLLKQHWPEQPLSAAFAQAGVPLNARAETVSVEQFVVLTAALQPHEGEKV